MNEILPSNSSSLLLPEYQQLSLWILWRLWKNRNLLLYQQKQVHWLKLIEYTKCDVKEWLDMEEYTSNSHQSIPGQTYGINPIN